MSEADAARKDNFVLALQGALESALIKEIDAAFTGEPRADSNLPLEGAQKAAIGVLVGCVQTQRLYFAIRSVIMCLVGSLIYFLVVWYLGAIDATQVVLLGILVFITSIVVSRLFDRQVVKVSKKIVTLLKKNKQLRIFVLKRL
jgi:hypothetical protein